MVYTQIDWWKCIFLLSIFAPTTYSYISSDKTELRVQTWHCLILTCIRLLFPMEVTGVAESYRVAGNVTV